MGRRTESLTLEQLARVSAAALFNARDLLRDAQLLARDGRWERAWALGVLSAEEFGKHVLATGQVRRLKQDDPEWPRFWKHFNAHPTKFSNFAMIQGITATWAEIEQIIHAADSLSTGAHNSKMRTLYVDWREGQLLEPRGAVEEAEVMSLLSGLEAMITPLAEVIEARGVDTVIGAFRKGEGLDFEKIVADVTARRPKPPSLPSSNEGSNATADIT